MKRWLALIKPNMEVALTFRVEIGLWFIVNSIPLIVLILVWVASYKSGHLIPGWDINRLVTYYMIGFFLDTFTDCYFENWIIPDIRAGRVDHLMIKPVGYLSWIMTGHVAHKLINIFLRLPIMILVGWLILSTFHIPLQTIGLQLGQVLPFLFVLFSSFMLQAGMSLIIVLLGYWLENAEGLQHFKWIVISLFSGVMVPLDFMPSMLKQVASALPLKYFHAVPIGMLQSSYHLQVGDVIYLVTTIVIVFTIIQIMWQKARLRYSSSGG